MRYSSRVLLCFALFLNVILPVRADSQTALLALQTQVTKACQARDLSRIKLCYDFDGAPQSQIDTEVYMWQEYFGDHGKTPRYVFEKIEYLSLAKILADQTINPKAIQSMTGPVKMNGTIYHPNLKVVGFLTTTFQLGSGSTGNFLPVGLEGDGTAKLTMACPVR